MVGRLEQNRPALFRKLFFKPRADVRMATSLLGPLVSLRWGNFVCTCPVRPHGRDAIGREFKREAMEDAASFRPRAGEVFVLNNHRWMHGRTAFPGKRRHFVRILAWLRQPLPAPPGWTRIARGVSAAIEIETRQEPVWVRERFAVTRFRRRFLRHLGNDEPEVALHAACSRVGSRIEKTCRTRAS